MAVIAAALSIVQQISLFSIELKRVSDGKNPVVYASIIRMLIAQRLRDPLDRGNWRC
jgi:hypothetical protein